MAGGLEFAEHRVTVLEAEVAQLRETVQHLVMLVDPQEMQAARRLAKITPDNATLKQWVGRSSPSEDLVNQQEDRPW